MVRRLLVTLLCIACGFSVIAYSPVSHAQTQSTATPAAKKLTKVPEKVGAKTQKPVPKKVAVGEQESVDKKTKIAGAQENPATSSKKPALAETAAKSGENAKPVAAVMPGTTMQSENLLPGSTKFWVSIPDVNQLEQQFDATQFGLLAKDPAIKPFIEGIREQLKGLLNDQNERFGLEVDDLHGVNSGEICIAGVLPELNGKQPVKGSHGLVLLVDVSKTEKEARELQKKVNAQMIARGAKQKNFPINGVLVTKSTIENAKRGRKTQSNFQAIINGQMLVSDNENIFRDVLRRLAAPKKIQKVETLAAQKPFKSVMEKTDLNGHEAHIKWFVDPFGYLELAKALENEDRANREHSDDWGKILKDQGFRAFKGIGGRVSVATGEHELLHQTYVYASDEPAVKNGKRVFELFDFSGNELPLTPAIWVPTDCSAYIVGNWEMTKALGSIGGIYDSFLDEEGAFKRMLRDFKVDPQMKLDIKKLVGLLNNRITVVSSTERPITESSERVVIGLPINGEPKFVFDSIARATQGRVINLGGIKVVEVEKVAEEAPDEDDGFRLPGEELEQKADEPERGFQLFEKRYFVVHKGNLLVANNKRYLRKLLAQKKSKLAESPDYIQVKESLAELTEADKISWRQFGRTDLALEANYEMLRRGEMGNSQTVLARVINQIFAKRAAEKAAAEGKEVDPDAIRKQKLDGAKLPANYAKSIAPYFGPMGWVMETEKGGWRITGCLLKKKGMTEVVQKIQDDEDSDSQQR